MSEYETTHPWLRFQLELRTPLHRMSMLIGEARSKCEHLAGAVLAPDVARQLYSVTLVKGAVATTAIEGNTLSEEQVMAALEGESSIPPSQEYQLVEIENVLNAIGEIGDAVIQHEKIPLNRERLDHWNQMLLEGTVHEPDAIPGQVRTHSVIVGGRYRGAPAEDLDLLIDKLTEFLASDLFVDEDLVLQFGLNLIKAVVAHIYIAWIHPYGDGNGRTARLVEAQILAESGIPLPAINLLSDHYNLTRQRYANEIAATSTSGGSLDSFILYAVEGYVDGLRQQVEIVRGYQVVAAFENYVYELAESWGPGAPSKRRRDVVLALSPDTPTPKEEIPILSTELAEAYKDVTSKTITRDVNALLADDLIREVPGGLIQNDRIIRAWLPPTSEV